MMQDDTNIALSIAGSDPSGGAGIQMDLRVFGRHELIGTTVLTALTAQSPDEVRAVVGLDPVFVSAQLATLQKAYVVRAAKTGMLWSAPIVRAVTEVVSSVSWPVVVDPVMVATSGARLLSGDAIAAYREGLLPCAALATPNLDEAAILLDRDAIPREELIDCARELMGRYGCAVLLKGGHLDGDPVDILVTDEEEVAFSHSRVTGVNTHGSGCMLSAAICAQLACGESLFSAVSAGLAFVHDALLNTVQPRDGLRLAGVEGARVEPRHLRIVNLSSR